MRRYSVSVGGAVSEVEIHDEVEGKVRVVVGGEEKVIELRAAGPQRYTWVDGTRVVTADVEAGKGPAVAEPVAARRLAVAVRGEGFVVEVKDARAIDVPVVAPAGGAKGPLVVRAPMPGRVVKLLVAVGAEVKAGAGVIVVEAMKMENELRAARDGKVSAVRVGEGAAVEAGQELLTID